MYHVGKVLEKTGSNAINAKIGLTKLALTLNPSNIYYYCDVCKAKERLGHHSSTITSISGTTRTSPRHGQYKYIN